MTEGADAGDAPAGAAVHAALASPTRRRLLHLLQAGDLRHDAHDLARQVGLHVTTVRFHLEALHRVGLVDRRTQPSAAVGRPRTVYSPVAQPEDGRVTYQELAALLSAHLASTPDEGPDRAEAAGIAWSKQLIPAARHGSVTFDDASNQLHELFQDMGFEPELVTSGRDRTLALHACPLRELARQYPDVVCSVHQGLLRGSLGRLGVAATSRLHPFVEPELCIARLSPLAAPDSA